MRKVLSFPEVILNQLRADCYPLVRTFRTKEEYNPICQACSLQVPETLEHQLRRCPGRAQQRRILGGGQVQIAQSAEVPIELYYPHARGPEFKSGQAQEQEGFSEIFPHGKKLV